MVERKRCCVEGGTCPETEIYLLSISLGSSHRLSTGVDASQAVAPREVVAAIREMLSAADLPLGLERERLLEQSLHLQAQLKATQAALGHQRAVRLLSQHRIPPKFYASWQGRGQ